MQVIDSTVQSRQEQEELKEALERIVDRCAQNGTQLQLWTFGILGGAVQLSYRITEDAPGLWPIGFRWPRTRQRVLLDTPIKGEDEDEKRILRIKLYNPPCPEIFREELIAFGEKVGLDVLDLQELRSMRYQ